MIEQIIDYLSKEPVIKIMGYGSIIIGGVGMTYMYFKSKRDGKKMLMQEVREEQMKKATQPNSISPYNTINKNLAE